MYKKRVKKLEAKSEEKETLDSPPQQEFKPPSPIKNSTEWDKIIESSDDEKPPISVIANNEPENIEIDAIRKRLAELKSGKFIKPKEETQTSQKSKKHKHELSATEKMHAT